MSTHEPKRGRAIILTSRPIEYAAVRIHLTNLHEETHLKGTIYERGTFIDWEIGIVQIDTGNIAAAIEAERAIAYFDPTIVLFVGISDGLNGVASGDVVAARKVYGYESGQEQGTLFLPQSDVGNSSYYLIERAKAEARKTDWQQRIPTHITSIAAPPDVFIGAIAAGEKIISSTQSPTFGLLQAAYSDTLAVEMEGRGFLLAAHMNEQLQALVIRGIVALIDDKHKDDVRTAQAVAAHHASAFAFEILAKIAVQQTVLSKTQQGLQLVDVYGSEKDADPLLDITLYNAGTRVALPTRVKIDILDVGEFYYGAEDDIDRSFLIPTYQYEIELSPDLKGKSKAIKISHLLNPGDTDRFQVLIGQELTNPHLAYIWYYLKITIIYNKQKDVLESVPLLLSVPPVDNNKYNIWQEQNEVHAQQNRITLCRMAALTDKRSESVDKAIKIFL
jgi:nucleoside phosphorylase